MSASASPLRLLMVPSIAVIAALVLVMAMAPTQASAAKALSLEAWLGHSCVAGHGPNSAKVVVTWKDKEGQVKQKATVRANSIGDWQVCGDGSQRVRKDDTISSKVGTRSRTVTVPAMRVVVDRDTNVVRGKGPKSTSIVVQVCEWQTFKRGSCAYDNFTTAPDGTYDVDFDGPVDFGSVDIKGRDHVMVFTVGQKDQFGRDLIAPHVEVIRGKARFSGTSTPSARLTVQLWDAADPTGTQKDTWTGRADRDFWWVWSEFYGDYVRTGGNFKGRFANAEADLIRVRTGDRVVAPKIGSDADFLVPAVTVAVNKHTDVVSGSCVTKSPFQIYAQNQSGSKWVTRKGTTATNGGFSRDLTKGLDLKRGHSVWASCGLPSGDVVARRTVVS